MTNTVTTCLSEFGDREMYLAAELLQAYTCYSVRNSDVGGLPESWSEDGVRIAFNRNSGEVFLANDECQVLVLTPYGLMLSYFTPYDGCGGR